MTSVPIQSVASFSIHGSGEMAERIRLHAWHETSFGPLDQWPLELLALVNLMLSSREIMTVCWGPDRRMIYNDAYVSQLGSRHPVLGQPLREVWPDVVDQVRSFIDTAFEEGESSYLDDSPLTVIENGTETVHTIARRLSQSGFARVPALPFRVSSRRPSTIPRRFRQNENFMRPRLGQH